MRKNKITATILATLVACTAVFGMGCSSGDEFSEEIDPTRTQIYVFNFYGGFRADWLISVKKQFEEKYKDYEGVDGKKGVQILMDNRKEYFNGGATTIRNGTNEVYFTEYMYFHGPKAGDAFLDITDWVTSDLDEYGEQRSIVDKLTQEQREYFSVDINNEAHYYALPHYESYEGIVYNKDLWKEKGFWFSRSGENATSMYDRFTSDTDDLAAGPDGEYNTSDDGMPATYADFETLCNYITQRGCTPFIWTGEHYKSYIGGLTVALAADYEGSDFKLNYTLNGDTDTLIKADGSPLGETKIDEAHAYRIANMAGRKNALIPTEKIVHNTNWQSKNPFNSSLSHHDAQALYLSSGYDGNKPIAMLLDGTWWEGEASESFADVAARYPAAKGKDERSFGWMPLPKADKTKLGKQTALDTVQGMTFVKATLAEEKKDIVEKFIRFVFTDEMSRDFTKITSACKALKYDIDENSDAWAAMTPYAKDLWTYRKNAREIIYPISDAKLFANNQGSFERSEMYSARHNGSNYGWVTEALHENPSMTAEQAFAAMIDYTNTTWFPKLVKG